MDKKTLRIRQLRESLGLKQKDFAEKIKITQAYLSEIEKGKKDLSVRVILAICSVFGVREEWLLQGKEPIFEEKVISPLYIPGAAPEEFVRIRLLADRAAGGDPAAVNERDVEGYVVIHKSKLRYDPKFYTCIRMRGDSMAPRLSPGTIVCISHKEKDPERLNRRMAAIYIKEEGVMVKRLIKRGKEYILMPENVTEENLPRAFNPARDRIIGRIAWWWAEEEE